MIHGVSNRSEKDAIASSQPATAPQALNPLPRARVSPPVKPPLPGEAPPLLLDVHAAARALGVPKKTVGNWNRSGRLPMPIRMGSRSLFWRADELAAWVRQGCPNRLRWETMKGGRR